MTENKIKIVSELKKDIQSTNFIKMASICILNNIYELYYSNEKIKNIHIYNDHIYYNFLEDGTNQKLLDSYFLMFACNYLSKMNNKDYSEILNKVLRDKLGSVYND